MVRHCHFVVCSCWNLRYCMIDHVVMLVLEHFWSVYFLSWCNLGNVGGLWNFDNVGSLWCCWMNLGLDFGSIGIVKKFVLWAYMNMFMMHIGNFVGMCKFCFMNMAKFCGHETLTYGKILSGVWCWFMENFCGYDFGYVRIYLLCMDM